MSNPVKLKTLLEGLSDKGIAIRVSTLARYTAENGVLVDITCGRSRGRFTLPPKLSGAQPLRSGTRLLRSSMAIMLPWGA